MLLCEIFTYSMLFYFLHGFYCIVLEGLDSRPGFFEFLNFPLNSKAFRLIQLIGCTEVMMENVAPMPLIC